MDIKELDKRQLILLVLLITFVVSIATGIITVSLMKQMPTTVPQTINNVIQRTIEKVTTVEVPATDSSVNNDVDKKNNPVVILGDKEALVNIYLNKTDSTSEDNIIDDPKEIKKENEPIGQGVIISEAGLILVDSNLLNNKDKYKVILNKLDFSLEVLKKFNNGFTILKISPITIDKPVEDLEIPIKTE